MKRGPVSSQRLVNLPLACGPIYSPQRATMLFSKGDHTILVGATRGMARCVFGASRSFLAGLVGLGNSAIKFVGGCALQEG